MNVGSIVLAAAVGFTVLIVGLVPFTALTAPRAQALAPPTGRFIDVDYGRLHFLDRGTGPIVVMVHGLSGSLRNFYGLIGTLARTCRVLVVDRPGSGHSTMLSGEHPTLRAQATLIAHFLHRLGL